MRDLDCEKTRIERIANNYQLGLNRTHARLVYFY